MYIVPQISALIDRFTGKTFKRTLLILCILQVGIASRAQVLTPGGGLPLGTAKSDTSGIQFSDSIFKSSISLDLSSHKSSLEEEVKYNAKDSIVMDLQQQQAHLYGQAVIEFQDIVLRAEYIMVDFAKKDVFARGIINDTTLKYAGRPQFEDNGQVYEADTMKYNFESKKGLSFGALTVQGDGYVHGKKVLRDSMENIYVKDARYTTCNLPEPHFYINADKIKMIPKKQIVTGPANLVVMDINTPLALPFGFFPIPEERKHGIIMPKFGESAERGFNLRGLGYYFPINEYFDLSVMGDVYFRGSWGVSLKSDYFRRYRYRGQVSFSYNLNEVGEPESPSYSVSNDYRLRWNYAQDNKAKPGRRFSADVNFVTSNFLKNNTTNYNDIISTTSVSSVSYGKSLLNNKLNFGLNANMDQNLSTGNLNLTLPQLTTNLSRQIPFKRFNSKNKTLRSFMRNLGFSYSGNLINKISTQDVVLIDGIGEIFGSAPRPTFNNLRDDFRNGVTHTVPLSSSFKAFKWFTVSPQFNYSEYWNFQTTRKQWDFSSDTLITHQINGFERAHSFRTSIGLSTRLYGMAQFKKGKIMAIRHVMQPRIGASYNPDFSKGKENGYRGYVDSSGLIRSYSIYEQSVVGRPAGGPQGSLTFGLNNNLEMKMRSKKDTTNGGVKKVKLVDRFDIGGSYNFLADSFNLTKLNLGGNTTLLERIRLTYSATFDPYGYTQINDKTVRNKDFALNVNQKLGHIVFTRLSIATNLNPEALKRKESANANQDELEYINQNLGSYVDFNIPWSLELGYTLTSDSKPFEETNTQQILSFAGDVSLTENWKIIYRSGFDITREELAFTSLEFMRDLHCWQMSLRWQPIQRQMFEFTIRAKSSTLQDLKLNRIRSWWDF